FLDHADLVVLHEASLYWLCHFFFSGVGADGAPHPFPTRRSSDLVGGPVDVPAAQGRGDERPAEGDVDPLGEPLQRRRDFGEVMPDRKSTRLNSSHVKISYAVFCLKKKITEGRDDGRTEKRARNDD